MKAFLGLGRSKEGAPSSASSIKISKPPRATSSSSPVEKHGAGEDVLLLLCEVICESFDQSSPAPRLSSTTKASNEALQLSKRIVTRDISQFSKAALEAVEDVDVLWAALVLTLLSMEELISTEQLAQIAAVDFDDLSEPPLAAPVVTVRRQQLLGAVLATAEQLIIRSKLCASVVSADLLRLFLRDQENSTRSRLSLASAHR
jgi:hypothetical protein